MPHDSKPHPDSESRLDSVTHRFSELAKRRHRYFTDLYESGRWRLYYTEQDFIDRVRDVVQAVKAWDELAQRKAPQRKAS